MQEADTLKVALALECEGGEEGAACGAWDYVVELKLCGAPDDAAAPPLPEAQQLEAGGAGAGAGAGDACDVEVARWVTGYGRPGRWLTDASAALPLLRAGRAFRMRLQKPSWSPPPPLPLVLSGHAASLTPY